MNDGENVSLIIFGASGDLTRRKLVPALCSLECKGRLPRNTRIIGVSRSQLTHQEFRHSLFAGMRDAGDFQATEEEWEQFSSQIFYLSADVTSQGDLLGLQPRLEELEGNSNGNANRVYYLALAPSLYEKAITNLGETGMARQSGGWRRVVIEKPFGTGLSSAQHLNNVAHAAFDESQIYRIDHYLGKETVQNLLVMRFANTIFEPLWNRNYIDHVQITVAETVSVSERADYYDQTGILRDMFQNHILQLLTLLAMEPPSNMDADALRNEKVKVLNSVRRIKAEDISASGIHAQYRGYADEPGVAVASRTPTYAALRMYVDNWRWHGVPFYLRSGKAMNDKRTEIIIQFRSPPHLMFPVDQDQGLPSNMLAICLQPDEGMHLQFQAKTPDAGLQVRPVDLEFHYASSFGEQAIPEAYERLLLDVVNGDPSLFIRSDEIEQAWSIIDPVIDGFGRPTAALPLAYDPGTTGPPEADEFLAQDGRIWLQGCGD